MSTERPMWSSDVPISVPGTPQESVVVPMYGFGMTQWGLVHDITDAERETLRTPSYAPEVPATDAVYDDGDV